MTFTTIIFDWSGVLGESTTRTATEYLSPLTEVPKADVLASVKETDRSLFLGQEVTPAFERLAGQLKVPPEEVEHAFSAAPATPVLDYAKSLKIRKILASNRVAFHTETVSEQLDGFSDVFFSCDLGIAKPDPVFFTTILEKAGLSPQECVFVDDKEKNVEVARALSITSVLFKDLEQLKADLHELGIDG